MKTSHLLVTAAWLAQACDDSPGLVARVVADLARVAERHRRLCERACNEPQKDIDPETGEGHIDRAIGGCEDRMAARFAQLKRPEAILRFQRDPRGTTVFLTPAGTDDTGSNRYYL